MHLHLLQIELKCFQKPQITFLFILEDIVSYKQLVLLVYQQLIGIKYSFHGATYSNGRFTTIR